MHATRTPLSILAVVLLTGAAVATLAAEDAPPPFLRTAAPMAKAHGACTLPPKGLKTHIRQSPISSRYRSTTIVRSSGTAPAAST